MKLDKDLLGICVFLSWLDGLDPLLRKDVALYVMDFALSNNESRQDKVYESLAKMVKEQQE